MKRGREESSLGASGSQKSPSKEAKLGDSGATTSIRQLNDNTVRRDSAPATATTLPKPGESSISENSRKRDAEQTSSQAATKSAKIDTSSQSNPAAAAAASKTGVGASGAGAASGGSNGEGVTGKSADGGTIAEDAVEGVPNETLFVGNLSYKVSEAVIIKLFTPFGKVVREQFCYHMTGPRRGEPRGFCFVEYSNVDDAAKAIRALHGRKLYGRPLRVRFMTVEGQGRMDYSTSDGKGSTRAAGGARSGFGDSGGAKIPPANTSGADGGAASGVTKLSLDKKVALLKLKLREAAESRR